MRGVWPEVIGLVMAGLAVVFSLALALWIMLVPAVIFYQADLIAITSVGIIGGADGPTSIFISANPAGIFYLVGVVVLALVAMIVLRRRIVRKCAGRKFTGN